MVGANTQTKGMNKTQSNGSSVRPVTHCLEALGHGYEDSLWPSNNATSSEWTLWSTNSRRNRPHQQRKKTLCHLFEFEHKLELKFEACFPSSRKVSAMDAEIRCWPFLKVYQSLNGH